MTSPTGLTARALAPAPLDARVVEDIYDAPIAGTPGVRRQTCLTPTLRSVLIVLVRHRGESLTYTRIADLVGVCDAVCYRAIRDLVGQGLVKREKGQRLFRVGNPPNRYVVFTHKIARMAEEARARREH
jgi:DNA-binding MarR family transcriptional regulator